MSAAAFACCTEFTIACEHNAAPPGTGPNTGPRGEAAPIATPEGEE